MKKVALAVMVYRGTKEWLGGKKNAAEIMSWCTTGPKQQPTRLSRLGNCHGRLAGLSGQTKPADSSLMPCCATMPKQQPTRLPISYGVSVRTGLSGQIKPTDPSVVGSGYPHIPHVLIEEVAEWLGTAEGSLFDESRSSTARVLEDTSKNPPHEAKSVMSPAKAPPVHQHAALVALAWNEEPKELLDGGFKKSSVIRSSSDGRPAAKVEAMKLIEATRAAKLAKAVQLAEEALQLEAQIKEEKIKDDLDAAVANGSSPALALLNELKDPSKLEKPLELPTTSDNKAKPSPGGTDDLRSRVQQLVRPYLSKEASACIGCSRIEKPPATEAATGALSTTAVVAADDGASKAGTQGQAEDKNMKSSVPEAAEGTSTVGEPEQEAGSSLVGVTSSSNVPKTLGVPKQRGRKQSAPDVGSVMSVQQTGATSRNLLGPYANQPKRRPPEKAAADGSESARTERSDTSIKGNLLGPMMSASGQIPQGPPQKAKVQPAEEGELDASSVGGSESDTSQLSHASSLASSVVNRAAGQQRERGTRRKKSQHPSQSSQKPKASVISVKDTTSSGVAGLLGPVVQKQISRGELG